MSTFLGQARARVPRLLESAHQRARLTVVPQRMPRVARVPFVILVLLLLGAGLVGLLVLNTSLQEGAFRAAALQTRQLALSQRQHDLELQVAAARNPQRLASRAAHLGMVPNTNPVFIDAKDGSVMGVPAPAVPGTGPELRPPPRQPHTHRAHRPPRTDGGTGADTTPNGTHGGHHSGNNGAQGSHRTHQPPQPHQAQPHPTQQTQR